MKYIRIYILLTFLLGTSCVSDFDFFPDPNSEVYVNAILYSGSTANIYLNRLSNFDSNIGCVSDANVTLSSFKDGMFQEMLGTEQLLFQDSAYIGHMVVEEGLYYSLSVELANGKRLTARTHVPKKGKIISGKLIFPAGFRDKNNLSGPFGRIQYDFEIPIHTKHFETLIIYDQNVFNQTDTPLYGFVLATNEDQVILAEGLPSNQLYTFVYKVEDPNLSVLLLSFEHTEPFLYKYFVHHQSVSEDYYLYKKSLYQHLDALTYKNQLTTGIFFSRGIFKSLAPVYSNIDGGKGIFAGISRDVLEVNCNIVGNGCN